MIARIQWRTLGNVAAFQVGWFCCVLGAANGQPAYGVLVGLAVLALHLFQARDWRPEIKLMLVVGCGCLLDQTLLSLGWLGFTPVTALLPVWMLMMWLLFATLLNVSLRWLHGRYWLATLFGLIGGPLAYLGGERLGALHLAHDTPVLFALAIAWAMLTPALIWLAPRLDGVGPVLASTGGVAHHA